MKTDIHFIISNQSEIKRILLKEIIYIQSNGMLLTYFTTCGKFFESKCLKRVQAKLGSFFFRINNSTIINKEHIETFKRAGIGKVIMKGGIEIIPSISRKPAFIRWYKSH